MFYDYFKSIALAFNKRNDFKLKNNILRALGAAKEYTLKRLF